MPQKQSVPASSRVLKNQRSQTQQENKQAETPKGM